MLQASKLRVLKKLSFISWNRQNVLIESVSEHIAVKTTTHIKGFPIFSVFIYLTFDISHREQDSFIVKCVNEIDDKVIE